MIPSTGMASTIVIRTKLSGITSRLRRSKIRQTRNPNTRRKDTGCNAAFYPEVKDRGKNAGYAGEVFGFGTLSPIAGRSPHYTLVHIIVSYSLSSNRLHAPTVRGTAVARK